MKVKFFFFLFSFFFLLFIPYSNGVGFSQAPAAAQTMSNYNYKLKTNILLTPDKNPSSKLPTDNSEPNVFVGNNYKVVLELKPFIFSISQALIDYGILSPTNPVSRANILSINNNYILGYVVSVFENHNLLNEISQSIIPDTTCDIGNCSHLNPGPWNNILTYGFGYRCDNLSDKTACPNDFNDSNYYKHFANISKSQRPQVLMKSNNIGKNQVRITYKINLSGSQSLGFYSNTITYIVTPNF